jgi:hypothetical protein
MCRGICLAALTLGLTVFSVFAEKSDPFLWLEQIDGLEALDWVKAQNAVSTQELSAVPEYSPIFERCLEILDSKERIPMPAQEGNFVYNFWQDCTGLGFLDTHVMVLDPSDGAIPRPSELPLRRLYEL